MFDPFKYFDIDGAIAKRINMESRDYIFFMAKYGKAQKGEESQYLYWDSEEDAQCAVDWITQYLIMKKLSS